MNWWSIAINIDTWICIVMVFLAIVILFKGQTPGGVSQGTKVKFPSIPKVSSRPTFGKYENRCREVFEKLFRKPFAKVHPEWLVNPATKRKLELDGCNMTIKTKLGMGLAFEYDGRQHAQKSSYFHATDQEFVSQVRRDFLKDRICKAKKVALIRIPHTVKYDNLEAYIVEKLRVVM
jgi:hypothetical protein